MIVRFDHTKGAWLRLSILLLTAISVQALAQGSYSPYVDRSYPTDVYFGDTHVHTNLSVDANLLRNRGLGPEEAYRLAKGETVEANNGMAVKLHRPLNFLVIADHASNMGVLPSIRGGHSALLDSPLGKQWASKLKRIDAAVESDEALADELSRQFFYGPAFAKVVGSDNFRHSVWANNSTLADRFNVPGQFTAFIGYEWASSLNLHRNVIFKDDADKTTQVIPFSRFDSRDQEDLWKYLGAEIT